MMEEDEEEEVLGGGRGREFGERQIKTFRETGIGLENNMSHDKRLVCICS